MINYSLYENIIENNNSISNKETLRDKIHNFLRNYGMNIIKLIEDSFKGSTIKQLINNLDPTFNEIKKRR